VYKYVNLTSRFQEIWCTETNRLLAEAHFDSEGHKHRDGAPSKRWFYPDGKVETEYWHKNGKFHRSGDLPASTCWDEQGRKTHEHFAVNGKPYRSDGQAQGIEFDPETGKKKAEIFFDDEEWEIVRRITFNLDTGNRELEEFFNGVDMIDEEPILHNENGAARIIYAPETGEAIEYQYFDMGLRVEAQPRPNDPEL
jgi:hypothetical protein